MRPIRNLQKRSNGVYYFRYYVPGDLVGRFGKRELIYSLKTRDLRAARLLVEVLRVRAHRLMVVTRQNKDLTAEKLKALAKRYFEEGLAKAQDDLLKERFSEIEAHFFPDDT